MTNGTGWEYSLANITVNVTSVAATVTYSITRTGANSYIVNVNAQGVGFTDSGIISNIGGSENMQSQFLDSGTISQ